MKECIRKSTGSRSREMILTFSLRPCEVTPGVLCAVPGFSVQARHAAPGLGTGKSYKADQGTRASLFLGNAKKSGPAQPQEESTEK